MDLIVLSAIVGVIVAIIVFVISSRESKPTSPIITPSESSKSKVKKNKGPAFKKKNLMKLSKTKKVFKKPEHPLYYTSVNQHTDSVTGVAFPPNDGAMLATVSKDRTLRLWYLASIAESQKRHQRINTEFDFCSDVVFSKDGHYALAPTFDQGKILVYRIADKKDKEGKASHLLKTLDPKHTAAIRSISLSDDASVIVTCTNDTDVHVISRKGELMAKINTNQIKNNMAAVSPDGLFVAVAAFTSDIRVWKLEKAKDGSVANAVKSMQLSKNGHTSGTNALEFSADSKRIVTASNDGSWKLWSIDVRYVHGEDPHCLATGSVDGVSSFEQLALSPDAALLAVSSGASIYIFETDTAAQIAAINDVHGAPITSLAWSSDASLLASSSDDSFVHLWHSPRSSAAKQ